jgi:heat shock protein HslJ
MKTYKILFALTLALTLSLASCASPSSTPELNGTSWSLVKINDQPVLENSNPTLVFEADSVGGNGSCNSFGGDYETKDSKLSFGALFSTMMYCEDTMEQETAYLAALQDAAGYQVKDGNLLILDTDGQATLTFAQQ